MESSLKITQPSFWNLMQDGKSALVLIAEAVLLPQLPLLIFGASWLSLALFVFILFRFSAERFRFGLWLLTKRLTVIKVWRRMPEDFQRTLLLAEHFRWTTTRPGKRGFPQRPGPGAGFLKLYGGQIILGVNDRTHIVIATERQSLLRATELAAALSLWLPWRAIDCSQTASAAH